MLVDPEILRAFAGQVDSASGVIHNINVGHQVATAASSFVRIF